MSVRAYQQATSRAESPRQTEYRLFGQVTRALMEAAKAGREDLRTLADAVDWNRRVWNTLAGDCGREGNGLPPQLRANIISLSMFVSKYSSEVLRHGAEIEPLIDINRSIMQGLEQRAAAQAAAEAAGPPAG